MNELISIGEKLGVSFQIKQAEIERRSPEKTKTRETTNQLDMLFESIKRESDWKVKSEIIEEIGKKLQTDQVWKISENFIEGMLDLTYDYNFKICITAMNITLTLMVQYPKEIKPKIKKIEDVMIEKICDLKMAVRQIAGKVLKKIFDNESKDSVRKLLNKLSNCSVVGKE